MTDKSSSTRKLTNANIIVGQRRPKNLKEILCSSDIKDKSKHNNVMPLCLRRSTCTHCPRLNKSKKIISTSTKRKYNILSNVSCNSQNLIYCIQSNNCNLQYVGQTKNQLKLRMNQHMSNIRTNADTPIARHFQKHGIGNFTISVLQLIRGEKDAQHLRNKWENYWIARLHSITPNGLNIQD